METVSEKISREAKNLMYVPNGEVVRLTLKKPLFVRSDFHSIYLTDKSVETPEHKDDRVTKEVIGYLVDKELMGRGNDLEDYVTLTPFGLTPYGYDQNRNSIHVPFSQIENYETLHTLVIDGQEYKAGKIRIGR